MATIQRVPIHDQPRLCDHIISRKAKSDYALRVGLSSIPNAGSGLFAIDDIPAGSDIFRSQPLIMVAESIHRGICDFCFLNIHSSVHSDGRFYGSVDECSRPHVLPCSACGVARYCSKKCQVKAWKSYHKYECAILKETPKMTSLDQALYRLLFWIKEKVISDDDMRVVAALETEFETRMENLRQGSDGGPEIDEGLQRALDAHLATDPGINLGVCHQLYYAIRTNALAIIPSEVEEGYGTCLDLVVALVNHCCDENAHVFFEGRELRCRALKDIAAGTEITVCYQDARQDVLHRRRTLKQRFLFTCDCKKCKSEMAEHIAAAINRQDYLAILREAQGDLNTLEHNSTLAFYKSARSLKTVMEYQNQLLDIEQRVYQGGNWPDHIEPMPSLLRTLGYMYLELSYIVGLEFVLKGTLYTRHHAGPRWVIEVMRLVKHMVFLSQESDESINWTGSGPPETLGGRLTLQDVARGYIIILCLCGSSTFGMDTKYVQAMYKWAANIIERPGHPSIDTDKFHERFVDSQNKLLTWAKMKTSRGLELPAKDTITSLRRELLSTRVGSQHLEASK